MYYMLMEQNQIVLKGQLVSYVYNQISANDCLLFLHGWGSSKEVWQITASKLVSQSANKPISMYAMDLPGFGKSPLSSVRQSEEGLSVADYAEVVKGFIEKLELKNVIIVGHSFGGRVGIKLSVLYPNYVKKLILVDSAGFVDNTLRKKLFNFVAKIIPTILKNKFGKYFASKDYLNSGNLKKTFIKVINEDLSEEMRKINTPTLLIWGADDTVTPVDFGYLMKSKIKNSKLKIIASAGHYSFLDKPEEFVKLLINFV